MKKKSTLLYLLYKFNESITSLNEMRDSSYDIVFIFSEDGELTQSEMKKLIPNFTEGDKISFSSKDDLTQFATNAISELNFGSVYLLATNDFNIGIETCHDLSSFREIFNRYGNVISTNNEDSQNKNPFGNFFK